MLRKLFFVFILVIVVFLGVGAYASPIGFVNSNIWISKTSPVAGDTTTLFAVLVNGSDNGLEGKVQFLDVTNNQNIGPIQTFSLSGGGTSNVIQATWKAVAGNHQFKAKITEAQSVDKLGHKSAVASEILSESTGIITVQVDSDHDGVTDNQEIVNGTNPNNPDSDHDGLTDGQEVAHGTNPLNADTDHDGDPDGTDPNPTNPNIFTPPDTDHDGKPDSNDSDIDNDGLYNWDETGGEGKKVDVNWGGDQPPKPTDPYKYDTDRDGVGDKQDYYPLDPKRSSKPSVAKQHIVSGIVAEDVVTTSAELEPVANGEVLGEKIFAENVISNSKKPIVSWWQGLFNWKIGALLGLWFLLLLLLLFASYRQYQIDEDKQQGGN